MASPPRLPGSLPPTGPIQGIKPGARATRSDPGSEARRAQRDAQEQIAASHRSVVEAQQTAGEQIDGIKDEYRVRIMEEHERQGRTLENERAKGYEQIRELKQRQEAEINRLRRDGERKLADLERHYSEAIYSTEKSKKDTILQLNQQVAQETQYLTKNHEVNHDLAQKEHRQKLEILRQEQDTKIAEMETRHRDEYEKLRANYEAANQESREQFEKNHQILLKDQQQKMARLYNSVSGMIRDIREDSSRKLAAYGDRQSDPFYQLISLDAELYEDSDAFILEARIPPHEREHISVSVKGNQVAITGSRRNDETLEQSPGRKSTTHSFQSFTETFPIDWPVEERGVAKFFDGDDLIVYIPKKGRNAIHLPFQSNREAQPERLRIEKPRFPDNLGVAAQQKKSAEENAENGEPDPA